MSPGPGVTVDALLDAVADHPRRLPDAFRGVPEGGWETAAARHPAVVGAAGRWRLPVYAYLVRAHGRTVLVDAGVGGRGTVAAGWLDTAGALPLHLDALGVDARAIDIVFFTHLHEDHVGWAADPVDATITFERARYVVSDVEWSAELRRGIRPHVEAGLLPARRLGRLETVAPGELVPGLEIVALGGHTAGHCGILLNGGDRQVLLAGDVFNHPVQVREPEIASGADADAAEAALTRRRVLQLLACDEHVIGSAHLPGGWWRARDDDGHSSWEPVG